MLKGVNLTDRHHVERARRSVAMLPARRKGVLNREEALAVLDQLLVELHRDPAG